VTRAAALVVLCVVVAACSGDFERMRDQPRYDTYGASTVFADGKAMQQAPAATVPVESDVAQPAIDLALLQLGQAKFDVYCAPCHGVLGDADTPVAAHMPLRQPPSLHEPRIVALSRDQVYGVVTNGYGFMAPYSTELSTRERWAVVAYVTALQRSQSASMDRLPAAIQREAQSALEGAR